MRGGGNEGERGRMEENGRDERENRMIPYN